METHARGNFSMLLYRVWSLLFTSLILGLSVQSDVNALTINVVDPNNQPVSDFRWLVEEDVTKASIPGRPAGQDPATGNVNLSLSFHSSYMPVVGAGESTSPDPAKSAANLTLDPAKRYFVSVLPRSGYQMGGVPLAPGQTSVTITVNPTPIPTAQISVFVFNDNQPLNGQPDLPQELGLTGFNVILKEAGGTYGGSGGQVTQDAFGNPLMTTYKQAPCASGTPSPAGYCIDAASGKPIVDVLGSGVITTGAEGVVNIKYLYPAKYTIEVSAPPGWQQTTTIEGTKGDDAWVKPNEPSFFQEFGPPGHHVFVGFTRQLNDTTFLKGSGTINGKVVNMHSARPPDFTFYNGDPVPKCWVGLNTQATDGGRAVYAQPCNADSTFSIPKVPAGSYQVVFWDANLDRIIASANATVPASGGVVDLQEVPVFSWFANYETRVFYDTNQNGFPDPGEVGIPDQVMNIRFRDGSIYQSMVTDANGYAKFNELFPFFNWMVAEVDFTRFKATGATVVVDNGGPVAPDAGWSNPTFNKLTPQPQSENGNLPYRVETGPALLEGMQTFLSQTNVVHWGKAVYGPGENGGLAGIVHYGITRAEDDPRYAAAETWEPGIPRVQVDLYLDCDNDGKIDQPNAAGNGCSALSSTGYVARLADVDNYPFCWRDAQFVADHPDLCPNGQAKGAEDVVRSGDGATFSQGDVVVWADPADATKVGVGIGKTDGWDDALPSGCQGPAFVSNGYTTDCYDGLRVFNQVRTAVFDGGYAFGPLAGQPNLPVGHYIVEAVTPPGYLHQGNGDKNVTFGDALTPSPLLLPPECVGDALPVPQFLNLFSDQQQPNPLYNPAIPGQTWNQCDRKRIDIAQGKNAAVDFHMFTEVPVAGHVVGFILDDTSNEFDPNSPTFGEKFAPPYLPVSIRDWNGREFSRVYADQWGTFNALVPSTYTINPPYPSGVSPNMVTTCMNDPGPILDTRAGSPTLGQMIIDPYFNRQYSQFCYTFQYLPGKTTYLDTPVIPVAAFAGPDQFPLDCEFSEGTPVLYSVIGHSAGGVSQNGPYVPRPTASAIPTLTIVSAGTVEVPNPAYDGTPATTKTIPRNFGFGANSGSVTLGGVALPIQSWSDGIIVANVPATTPVGSAELLVTGANGQTAPTGITVTVGGRTPKVVTPGSTIQAAIDSAVDGDLILIPPGRYDELVIMNKKVQLQGTGALSTIINAAKVPADKLQNWRTKVNQLYAAGTFDLVPGQTTGVNVPNNEPNLFNSEEGPGILVVAKSTGAGVFNNNRNARIDGLTITGGDTGGGIFVNGYARYLEIANNKVVSNYGAYGGGIRLGHPELVAGAVNNTTGGYTNSFNTNVRIHHNHVTQNGSETGAGGGLSISAGSANYEVRNNFICGNFTMGNGGGIGHLGLSNGGTIANNTVIFNETFNQGLPTFGGGIYIGGQAPLGAASLSPGSGNVTVSGNLVQGNSSGSGDGGGIAAQSVNGLDVLRTPAQSINWYQLTLTNNTVVDNETGLAGGGISLQDVAKANISNNTVANNDSTGTAGSAFPANNPNQSDPQPAGIVSRAHSTLLYNTITIGSGMKTRFSNPTLSNNIVWHNRSFYWAIDTTTDPATYGLVPAMGPGVTPVYSDLAVLGTPNQGTWPTYRGAGVDMLNPQNCDLTDATGYAASNTSVDPAFVAEYFNGSRSQTILQPEMTTSISTAAAFDEGGSFIDTHFGPLTLMKQPCPATGTCLYGDYHLQAGSPATGMGAQ